LSEIQNIDWLFLSGKAFSQIAAPLAAEYDEFSTGKYRDNLTSGVTIPFTSGTDAGGND
jgi:hypothetical protein